MDGGIHIIDLDIYGRNSTLGGGLLHTDDYAISNAIIFSLTADKGDFLYDIESGGILNEMLFNPMTVQNVNKYETLISNYIDEKFSLLVTDVRCQIKPDYDNRVYEINVGWRSLLTNNDNLAIFYTQYSGDVIGNNVIYDVYYEDDNLLAFVLLNKDIIKDSLVKNIHDNKWYWGRYRLVNFNEGSSNFEDIYYTINSGGL